VQQQGHCISRSTLEDHFIAILIIRRALHALDLDPLAATISGGSSGSSTTVVLSVISPRA
jgi:hypothetical protein